MQKYYTISIVLWFCTAYHLGPRMCGHSKASLLEIHVVCLSSRLSVIQPSLVMLSYNYFSMGVTRVDF